MLLLLDWDETISAHDTLSLIAPAQGTHAGPSFASYSQAYAADLEAHTLSRGKPRTLKEQYEALDALDSVELASQARIESGGLFSDADLAALDQRASLVELRSGWLAVSAWLERKAAHVEHHIVSVGWSARFIASALKAKRSRLLPRSICANELQVDEQGRATGQLTKSFDPVPKGEVRQEGKKGIRVASHKLGEVRRIHEEWKTRGGKGLLVYAGDSTTDTMALLHADVGIVVGEATSFKAMLERIGGEKWLTPVERWTPESKGERFNLVHVSNWEQGLAVLQTLLEREMAPPMFGLKK